MRRDVPVGSDTAQLRVQFDIKSLMVYHRAFWIICRQLAAEPLQLRNARKQMELAAVYRHSISERRILTWTRYRIGINRFEDMPLKNKVSVVPKNTP